MKEHEEPYNIVVVGAGASGLIAASRAAEKGVSVLLLEKKDRAGRKLLITGKGRCNITNTASQTAYYKHIHPQPRFLKHAFSRFFNRDVVELLEQHGVETTEERGGRVYPSSNQSKDILEALLQMTQKNGVTIWPGCRVNKIITGNQTVTGVEIISSDHSQVIDCQKVILCTGGKSYPATGSEGDGYDLAASQGHSIVPVRPALVPLVTREKIEERMVDLVLKNVRVTLWVNGKKRAAQFGEMFFTSFGLSGPVILTLSRIAVDEVKQGHIVNLSIDLKPALDEKKLDNRLLRDLNDHGKKKIISLFKMWLPADIIPLFLEHTGIDPSREASHITAKERRRIKMLMKSLTYHIKGPRSFQEAIITAGGIPTHEILSKTMESRLVRNLYFAGELIDLDGDTGGYNLQIAWSTGWLAGEEAATSLIQRTTR